MKQSSIPSLDPVSRNNKKVERSLDRLVEAAYGDDPIHRSDREEVEKTSQLMLLLSLILGETDSDRKRDSL